MIIIENPRPPLPPFEAKTAAQFLTYKWNKELDYRLIKELVKKDDPQSF